MTQENKELLIKDLSARLPYEVKFPMMTFDGVIKPYTLYSMSKDGKCYSSEGGYYPYIKDIKPYLFPMSSMTEEQKRELRQMDAFINTFGKVCFAVYDEYGHDIIPTYEDAIRITNWLNKNHFDYRGLIEKGLALDATGLNIY